MTVRSWTFAVACALFAAGCQTDAGHDPTPPPPPAPYVGVSASAGTVVANGTNTVTLTVTNTGGGSVTVTTDRGTFSTGGTSTTVSGASVNLTLVTCSAAAAGCVGNATITVSGAAGTTATTVAFTSLAAACQASCTADSACGSLACNLTGGGTGTCSLTTPRTCVAPPACTANPVGATTETSCTDTVDNDCDGQRDCQDTNCNGQPCAGGPTFFCQAGACTDITTGLALTVTPARTRLPANGTSTTEVVVQVTSNTDPLALVTVTAATNLGTIAPAAVSTDAEGKARFTFTASATAGMATVTAQLSGFPSIRDTATITMPRLGALQLVEDTGSVQYRVMGVKGGGWRDLGWVHVKAVDDVGEAYPDGLAVRFEHRQLGGSTLGWPSTGDTATCRVADGCVGYQGIVSSDGGTPETGLANAWIYTGTAAGTLAVTATASIAGVTRQVALPTMAVTGARASATNFAVMCSPRNLPALGETDCAISLVDAPFTCEAVLKDRYGNVLGRETQVIFSAEAGAVGQATSTPAYDPDAPGDSQMELGIALQGFNTMGAGLPFDVDPLTTVGEPWSSHGLDGCGTRTHNPRDGVVTIVAHADGEEAFFDANGDGTYEVGEPFVDLGEPYVDQDDSGTWEPGEWFLDLDDNKTWTPPNGAWDGIQKIWSQTFVVYTGAAATVTSGGNLLGTRWAGPGTFAACTPTPAATPFDVAVATTVLPAVTQTYTVVASDLNLNRLSTSASYAVELVSGSVTANYLGLPSYADLVGMGWRYWPCANGGAGPCASQCRIAGPAACLMRPEFTGFSCGVAAEVDIEGGTAGPAKLSWSVEVPWDRYGTSIKVITERFLGGVSR